MTTPAAARSPTLSVVIPALDEEESIGSTVARTLAVRDALRERAGVELADVIVVNDGSTDRTGEIAAGFDGVHVVTHTKRRGYGAALKAGFGAAQGDLLAFLDADGTCDPAFFADLCSALLENEADVAIGSRLGPTSEMPAVRRLGNRIFAGIIRAWSGDAITDSASGMRVLRRSALARLYPLPDGMHFTPAMSSLAIFDPHLTIVEVPMPYTERAGRSKLQVVRDGWRFLRVIVETALTYRPLRFLGSAGAVALVLALAYGALPVAYYAQHQRLEEWMIYRLVAVVVAITVGVNLVAAGVLAQQTVSLIHEDVGERRGSRRWLDRLLLRYFVPLGVTATIAGIALNWTSLVEYVRTGQVSAHWIYVLTGGLLVTVGLQFVAFGIMARVVSILAQRKAFARERADDAS
jgi:glycosyltransferase involved in cell wall biosynthesis